MFSLTPCWDLPVAQLKAPLSLPCWSSGSIAAAIERVEAPARPRRLEGGSRRRDGPRAAARPAHRPSLIPASLVAGPLSRSMSVPAPNVFSGGQHIPSTSRQQHEQSNNGLAGMHGNGGGASGSAVGGGGGGGGVSSGLVSPGSSSGPHQVSSTSPLVVPQPVKIRPPKTYHCRMCDQVSPRRLLLHLCAARVCAAWHRKILSLRKKVSSCVEGTRGLVLPLWLLRRCRLQQTWAAQHFDFCRFQEYNLINTNIIMFQPVNSSKILRSFSNGQINLCTSAHFHFNTV